MCLAVPMRVMERLENNWVRVSANDVEMKVSLDLVEKADVGDYVIVHAGFAIEVMDEKAGLETLKLLNQLAEGES